MAADETEIERRAGAGLQVIKAIHGTPEAEDSVTLFVSHHLDELEQTYWQKHTGKAKPSPEEVLALLVPRSHWSDEDDNGIDVFDFTLPVDVTDYVLSVTFDDAGNATSIAMES